jgi:putative tricarboxylic transport membrane protein
MGPSDSGNRPEIEMPSNVPAQRTGIAALIRGPKDFWTGVIYVLFGGLAFWIARDYGFGTASRMGPGYFPSVLSALLVLIGLISLVRSFIVPTEPLGNFAIKAGALIILATVLFGFLVNRAGLIIALLALVLVSAAASQKFRFEWKAVLGLVVLIAFCALVFVWGLGVPMPLVGTWFGE